MDKPTNNPTPVTLATLWAALCAACALLLDAPYNKGAANRGKATRAESFGPGYDVRGYTVPGALLAFRNSDMVSGGHLFRASPMSEHGMAIGGCISISADGKGAGNPGMFGEGRNIVLAGSLASEVTPSLATVHELAEGLNRWVALCPADALYMAQLATVRLLEAHTRAANGDTVEAGKVKPLECFALHCMADGLAWQQACDNGTNGPNPISLDGGPVDVEAVQSAGMGWSKEAPFQRPSKGKGKR